MNDNCFQNTMSLSQINNYIKAFYYLQIQIYEKCNNFNEIVNNMIINLEREFKNNNKQKNINLFEMSMPFLGQNYLNSPFNQENFYRQDTFDFRKNFEQNNNYNQEIQKFVPSTNLNLSSLKNKFQDSYYNDINSINQNSSDLHKNDDLTKEKSDIENTTLNKKKQKFLDIKKKNAKKYFQISYMFKNKIKRIYRIDVMTKKLNINLYNFLKDNQENLKISSEILDFFKNNIKFSTRNKILDLEKKYPKFRSVYEEFLKSEKFKKMINIIKTKHDEEYLKLFFRHTKNFLNLYIKDTPYCKIGRRLGSKPINSVKNKGK